MTINSIVIIGQDRLTIRKWTLITYIFPILHQTKNLFLCPQWWSRTPSEGLVSRWYIDINLGSTRTCDSLPPLICHTFNDMSLDPVIICNESYVITKHVISSVWLTGHFSVQGPPSFLTANGQMCNLCKTIV